MEHYNTRLPNTFSAFLWFFLRDYKLVVIAFASLALTAGFWGPFNSLIIKHIINNLPKVHNGDSSALYLPAALVAVNFIVFDNFTWRSLDYIRGKFIPLIMNQIIHTMMAYTLHHSHQFFQENLSGKLSKQITNLAEGFEALASTIIANFLRGTALLLTAFVASYSVNPVFCFILIIWFIVFASVSMMMSKKLVRLADIQAEAESSVTGELVDTLSNQNNVRLFAAHAYEIFRISPFFKDQQTAYTRTYFYTAIMYSIQGALIAIMMAFSSYFLVYLYGKDLITSGDFVLILGLAMETGHMMWYTMSEVDDFNKVVGKCKQSLSSLVTSLEIVDYSNATILKCTSGEIIFNKVKFHYKGTEALFQDKSIEIKAGQKVGLVGYSGSGKSTFVNLILRFYDITTGSILIDGHDISQITQRSLRENIGMIPQDPSLFHRSLMDNIRYGCINASEEEVIDAAKKAHAHEFIKNLPHGYQSIVGERGVKLSGGQRQRIAIARAILKNAPILILDEATSQLDSVTENMIQESLATLMEDKTTIVIAHRLSTLLHMDRILVFDKGKIVEDGSHVTLLSQNGLYKTLWEAQVGGFLGDAARV